VDGKCHEKEVPLSVSLSGFVNVTQYDATALKKALVENGPITIAINAAVRSFSFYSNGVYYDPECYGDEDHLDHQVLLVGYGTLNKEDFWLVKNSWSTHWGNDGYVLISQRDNNCGVTTSPSYPIIA
jgi:C1A family cysteine protease